jgi:hypothetical protein
MIYVTIILASVVWAALALFSPWFNHLDEHRKMTVSKEQLIDALYNEYVFLCHDDFEPGVDIEPEDYLTILKDMTYDELIEETCTDDIYHISEFVEAWG